jgi:hypothetical protein
MGISHVPDRQPGLRREPLRQADNPLAALVPAAPMSEHDQSRRRYRGRRQPQYAGNSAACTAKLERPLFHAIVSHLASGPFEHLRYRGHLSRRGACQQSRADAAEMAGSQKCRQWSIDVRERPRERGRLMG